MAFGITRAQAAERAFNLSVPDGSEESGVTIPEVQMMINDAYKAMVDDIAKSKKFYRLHDPNISVAITSGVGVLPEDVIGESIPDSMGGVITFTRTDVADPQFKGPLKWLPDLAKLKRPRPGGDKVGYYTLYGSGDAIRLLVYSARGVACSGTAVVTAARYYSFETAPSQLEDEFVFKLAGMVKARPTNAPTGEEQEERA